MEPQCGGTAAAAASATVGFGAEHCCAGVGTYASVGLNDAGFSATAAECCMAVLDGEGSSLCSTATGGLEEAEGAPPRAGDASETPTPPGHSVCWRSSGSRAVSHDSGRSRLRWAAELTGPEALRRRLFEEDEEEEEEEAGGAAVHRVSFGLSHRGGAYTSLVLDAYGKVASFHLQAAEDEDGAVLEQDANAAADNAKNDSELPAASQWAVPHACGPAPGVVVLIAAGGLRDPISRLRGRLTLWTEARSLDGPLTFVEANPCGTRPFSQDEVCGRVVLVRGSMEASCLKQVLHAGAGNAAGILIADDKGDELCRVSLPIWAGRLVVPTAFAPLSEGLALAQRLCRERGGGLRLAAVPVPRCAPKPASKPATSPTSGPEPVDAPQPPLAQVTAAPATAVAATSGALQTAEATPEVNGGAREAVTAAQGQPTMADHLATTLPAPSVPVPSPVVAVASAAEARHSAAVALPLPRRMQSQPPLRVLGSTAAAVGGGAALPLPARMQSQPPLPVHSSRASGSTVARGAGARAPSAQPGGGSCGTAVHAGPTTARQPRASAGLRGRDPARVACGAATPALVAMPPAPNASSAVAAAAPALVRELGRRPRCSAPPVLVSASSAANPAVSPPAVPASTTGGAMPLREAARPAAALQRPCPCSYGGRAARNSTLG